MGDTGNRCDFDLRPSPLTRSRNRRPGQTAATRRPISTRGRACGRHQVWGRFVRRLVQPKLGVSDSVAV